MNDLQRGTALVIGVDEYGGGIRELHSAVNDARAIVQALRDGHGYQATLLLNEQASGEAICNALETALPPQLSENSPFLLYFAGHGVARGDGTEGPQGYLLPHDARPGESASWVSMNRVRKALERLPCRHVLVILDCCFAGAFRWASTRAAVLEGGPLYDSQYERYLKGVAWHALTSASYDEKAMDVLPGQENTRDRHAGSHSPFAEALLRGLNGAADTATGDAEPDGVITATELYQYAFDKLVPASAESWQTPGIWPLRPDNAGQYIFHNPQRPKKTVPDPPLDDKNNPWLGLSAYSAQDAPLFFGRERVVGAVLARIADTTLPRLVEVVGASGTGKSSVAKAGVLPRLEDTGDWTILRAPRLDAQPERILARVSRTLDESGGRKLLFIDQFEELYTLCPDRGARDAFLTGLRALIDSDAGLTVLLTLRTDFEPQPAGHEALSDLWQAGRIVVPAFSADEFRECIEGPAAVKALYFEPEALIGELVDEVMAMPGALPMLSFALSEMYQQARRRRRESGSADRALTRADYEATGGVVGALHRRATDLYEAGTPPVRATIRRVFLRMLAQDGARLSRRRVDREELRYPDPDEQARVESVVESYIDARLLVADSGQVEPAHDTLVVAWQALLQWLSEAGPQNLVRAIWRAATDWRDSGREAGLTWHDDPRLPLALSASGELNALEREFVHSSERLRKRRLRRLIAVTAVTLAVIVMALVAALQQWRAALAQTQLAEQRLARAQAEALLANAQAQTDPLVKGVLVSEIAARGLPVPGRAAEVARQAVEGMERMTQSLQGGIGFDVSRRVGADHISYLVLEQDSERGRMNILDSWAFEPRYFADDRNRGAARSARYASNGRSVYADFGNGSMVYWPDPLGAEAAVTIADAVSVPAASLSGTRVAVVTAESARVIDVDPASGATRERVVESGSPVSSVAIDGAGSVVATGSQDGRIALWDGDTGAQIGRYRMTGAVTGVALDVSGTTLAGATADGAVALWQPGATGEPVQVGQCGGAVSELVLAPNGRVLAAVCDGRAWVWRADELAAGRAYDAAGVTGLRFVSWPGSFSHDGLWLLGLRRGHEPLIAPVVTARGSISSGAASGTRPVDAPWVAGGPSAPDATEGVRVDPDVTAAVVESDDAVDVVIEVRDPVSGAQAKGTVGMQHGFRPEAFHVYKDASGRRIFVVADAGVFWSGILFYIDPSGPDRVSRQTIQGTEFRDAALSPDGTQLLIVAYRMNPNIISDDPKLYRTVSLQTAPRELSGQRFVREGRFSRDGTRIVTTDCRGETRVWNADGSGDPIVINAAGPGSEAYCGPDSTADETRTPSAWFDDEGEFVLTQLADEPPQAWAVGFESLSEQIRRRTFVCLTPAQREALLGEFNAEARPAYTKCLAALGFTDTGAVAEASK